ncbi:MAG TPA: hypothetical protein VJM79_04625, partial [Rhizorhapis sp.]|nr:hypothetical protein [Rhizorhapis sp.]
MSPVFKTSLPNASVLAVFLFAGAPAHAGAIITQTNLVSNVAGLAAITDPQLVNPWGFSHSATSPFWISNQGSNDATLYAVTGSTNVSKVNINPLAGFVAIPTTAGGPQGPTGQVFNPNAAG